MASINKVILVGHLGKDPDVRHLEGNVSVASFPLATSEFHTRDGKRIEQTEWHNVVLWRSLAESAIKYLKKGKLIYVEGKLRTRTFVDREGIRRYVTEIVAEQFHLLGRRSDFEPKAEEGQSSNQTFEENVDFRENDGEEEDF